MTNRLLDLLLPTTCAGCGTPGEACCPRCAGVWAAPAPVDRGPVHAYALARYRGLARRLVLAYKEKGRRDLAEPLGAALAGTAAHLPGLPRPPGTLWLVPVPSRRGAARARGGSHMLRLARCCAAGLAGRGRPVAVAPALVLGPGARDAVGLDRRQREANLHGRVRLRPAGLPPPGAPVLLLDDVLTTGATAAACTRVLRAGGFPVAAMLTLTVAG